MYVVILKNLFLKEKYTLTKTISKTKMVLR